MIPICVSLEPVRTSLVGIQAFDWPTDAPATASAA